MRTKAVFLLGGALGYVLGTRAGREQFEKIRGTAQSVWQNPKVQDTVSGVQEKVSARAPELKEKVTGAVRSVRGTENDPAEDTWASDTTDTYSTGTTGTASSTTDDGRPTGPTGLS